PAPLDGPAALERVGRDGGRARRHGQWRPGERGRTRGGDEGARVRRATVETHGVSSARPAAGLRELLHLAWPVVLSRSTQSVVGLCDALFSARLGDQALAAVTTGAINMFSIAALPMGTVFIVQSFAAQLQGRGDLAAARRYAWHALVLAAITCVLAIAVTPVIGAVLRLFGFPPAAHGDLPGYVCGRFWSMGPFVAVEALGNWFAGLGDTGVQMRASLITMTVNVPLCWMLMFGRLGAPAMGVRGAALAAALAT